jgi:hypothetical protein
VILFTGGIGVRQRQAVMQRLGDIPPTEERLLVATGRYIGEDFASAIPAARRKRRVVRRGPDAD